MTATATFASFRQLLDERASDESLVAFGRGGARTRRDLAADAAACAARIAGCGVGRWLLCSDDSYAVAAALLALARVGSVAVFPPNRRPETLRHLATGAVGVLVDSPAALRDLRGFAAIAILGQPVPAALAVNRFDREAAWIEFRTSGTTGDGRPVRKALRHLEDEVIALEERLGANSSSHLRVFSTASHQHIYGLLFRVLWPLAAGRAFQRETLLHTQELLPRIMESPEAALVTTPVHLKRLAAHGGLRPLRRICRVVFSSGGPLDAETAKAVTEQLGAAPVEVFGSTETGGIAIRQRDRDGEAFRALPRVELDRSGDGRLEVTSPFVSVGDTLPDGRARVLSADRVELVPGGGFRLLGRADRVVKVGGKRLSLPEMERVLTDHPAVAEVALLVFDERVHAVVVPSLPNRPLLDPEQRRSLRTELTSYLSDRFEPVLLPRAWRFVAMLPRDAQDKIPHSALVALFADRRERRGRPSMPRIVGEGRAGEEWVRELDVPDDLAALEGHFPGRPLVPGVVQLGWVVETAAAGLGRPLRLTGIETLKFPEPLRPGHRVQVAVSFVQGSGRLRFQVRSGARVHAVGRARMDDDAARGDVEAEPDLRDAESP
jgi:acyl-coenzyme A synthetase/AMP-(fatty) acid ligase/3-hydroxymyristoyl/3-hydroxydecanoyl-(acyl carrier protein) dehydratase